MNKLTYLRGKKGLTVRGLAEKSGVNASTIVQIEKGRRKAYISTLGKLANALEVDLSELAELGEENDEQEPVNQKIGAA